MPKILISGKSGFLGTILSAKLENQKFEVCDLLWKNEQIDITKPFQITEDSYDVVLHLAGKAHVLPKTAAEEQEFYSVNFEGTKNLCNALESLSEKPKAFIFISTVAVYGVDSGSNIKEDHPLNGDTPYAKSKILAEEFLADWAKENQVKLSILRLPLIAGPNPPGNLSAMMNGIKTGKYLSIGKADARKSMIWAEDIAEIIPVLAEVGGTYNLTDGHHPNFKELETVFSKVYGKKDPLTIPLFAAKILGKFGDLSKKFPLNSDKLNKITSTLTFNDEKARNMLGWKPNFVLEKFRNTL